MLSNIHTSAVYYTLTCRRAIASISKEIRPPAIEAVLSTAQCTRYIFLCNVDFVHRLVKYGTVDGYAWPIIADGFCRLLLLFSWVPFFGTSSLLLVRGSRIFVSHHTTTTTTTTTRHICNISAIPTDETRWHLVEIAI